MRYKQGLHMLIRWVLEMAPNNHTFSKLRYLYYRRYLGKCAGEFSSMNGLVIDFPHNVYLDRGISFNRHVIIDPGAHGIIRIGNNCLIGPFTLLRAEDHNLANVYEPIRIQGHIPGSITIESNCWIGAHVTIKKDVIIGTGSVVGANSVVTHDVEPYSIVGGNPAVLIRKRDNDRSNRT